MVAKKKKRTINYLNNASLMEQIKISKEQLEIARGEDPATTAASCMTPELVNMLVMLVQRYSKQPNWAGYSWLEDMQSEAVISLLNGALKFNPEVGQNPFGYLTQIVYRSFLTTLEKEKKVRTIRDNLLEDQGLNPSHTRQIENDSSRLDRIEQKFYEEQEQNDEKDYDDL